MAPAKRRARAVRLYRKSRPKNVRDRWALGGTLRSVKAWTLFGALISCQSSRFNCILTVEFNERDARPPASRCESLRRRSISGQLNGCARGARCTEHRSECEVAAHACCFLFERSASPRKTRTAPLSRTIWGSTHSRAVRGHLSRRAHRVLKKPGSVAIIISFSKLAAHRAFEKIAIENGFREAKRDALFRYV